MAGYVDRPILLLTLKDWRVLCQFLVQLSPSCAVHPAVMALESFEDAVNNFLDLFVAPSCPFSQWDQRDLNPHLSG